MTTLVYVILRDVIRMFNSVANWRFKDIIVEQANRVDAFGKPDWQAPQTIKCYPEYKSTLIRNLSGDEELSTIHLYIDGVIPIGLYARIQLDGKKYLMKAREEFYVPSGVLELQVIHL